MSDMEPIEDADRNVLCNLVHQVGLVGDREFQDRIWVRSAGPEWSTFDEVVAQIFDDSRIDDMVRGIAAAQGMTREQVAALKEFAEVYWAFVEAHPGPADDALLISLPEWGKVVDAAAKAFAATAPWRSRHCGHMPEFKKP
jgi:hypothetical protein